MQAPMSTSPSMHGTLSAVAEGAGAEEADAAGTSAVALEAAGAAEADGSGGGGVGGTEGGGAGAGPQASAMQGASITRASRDSMR
jgi:hypothetical protein